jgi:hypothetical protein
MRLTVSLLIDAFGQHLRVNKKLFADLAECPGQSIVFALQNGPFPGFLAVQVRVFFGDVACRNDVVKRRVGLPSSCWTMLLIGC